MRRIEAYAGATMVLFLAGCVGKEKSNPGILDAAIDPDSTRVLTSPEIIEDTPRSPTVNFPLTPTPSIELTPTPEVVLTNPWKGHVFNQRCSFVDDNKGGTKISCLEAWAEKPLEGGKCRMAGASCNAAATSYVLNDLVSSELFMKILGQPGITPDVLVEKVYTNLPDGYAISMGCKGAGSPTVDKSLQYFGLETREVPISEYTVADVVKSLKPNERLMVSMIGKNAAGKTFKHWSVANGVGMFKGHETVYFNDSYFYKNLKDYDPHMVYFEESPDIMNDPTRYTGKAFDYTGALIVTLPEEASQISYQEQIVKNDSRFTEIPTGIEEKDLKYIGGSVAVGEDRYRISVRYQDRPSDFYYYDPYYGGKYPPTFEKQIDFKWGDFIMPLYLQLDPRWAGKKLDKVNPGSGIIETFGDRSCGLTIAAALFSMRKPGDTTPLIYPYLFYQKYYPDFTGYRTTPWRLMETIKSNNFNVEEISYPTEETIGKAIDENKLVVVNTMVNFKWYGFDEYVNHFVLILGKDKSGSLLIYDPYWGPFVTKIDDLNLSYSGTTVFTIGYPQ